MTAPTVSVIMNAYNGEEHLRAAIDSVLAQTYTDWELVFWDDQSSDRTADICRSYRDPRCRYLLAPTRTPLGRARIDAVAQARGQWIAFLDQDDVWTPDKLGAQLALALEDRPGRPVGLVYGRAAHLHPSGRTSVHDHRHEFKPLPEGDIFPSLFSDACYIAMSTVLVRAQALRDVGGVPSDYELAIDYQMYLALARRFDARAVQSVCCLYRLHPGSLSQTKRAEVCREVLRIIESWRGKVDDRELDKPRRIYETLLAVEDLRAGRLAPGMRTLLERGSPAYLASRPLARGWRALRRRLQPSPWPAPPQAR